MLRGFALGFEHEQRHGQTASFGGLTQVFAFLRDGLPVPRDGLADIPRSAHAPGERLGDAIERVGLAAFSRLDHRGNGEGAVDLRAVVSRQMHLAGLEVRVGLIGQAGELVPHLDGDSAFLRGVAILVGHHPEQFHGWFVAVLGGLVQPEEACPHTGGIVFDKEKAPGPVHGTDIAGFRLGDGLTQCRRLSLLLL